MARRVVMLGAGHAHLYALKRTSDFISRGFELVLVAPDIFWYSGLATGVLAGNYSPELDQVDVGALVAKEGGQFIRARASAIDVAAQAVSLDTGASLDYDVLSCNLGSDVPLDDIPGAVSHGYAVKPVRNLWDLRQALESRIGRDVPRQALRIVIVGGGATGCEIAANVQHLVVSHGGEAHVTVLVRGDSILQQMSHRAAQTMRRLLEQRGVQLLVRSRVVEVDSEAVVTAAGERIPYDFLVHATGLTPSPIFGAAGLPTGADGALLVDRFLRSVANPQVFGGGDCIALPDRELAKVGVYAVRESPILYHNLLATLQGRRLKRFRPQRRYLLILNLGDGSGLLTWGPFFWHSRLAFWFKDRIDRAFLRTYQNL